MNFSDLTSSSSINAKGSAIGFSITLAGLAFEVFSAHCSSPWTSETFGGDPEKARSTMKYVWRSIVITEVLGVGGVLLAHNVAPLIATTLVSLYMFWTYTRAMKTAVSNGPQQWQAPQTAGVGSGYGW